MTENEEKAVKFIENIKSHATVTLDHIAKEEPNVSPLIYKGREEKGGHYTENDRRVKAVPSNRHTGRMPGGDGEAETKEAGNGWILLF